MVLTQLFKSVCSIIRNSVVSIPLWFLRNRMLRKYKGQLAIGFPYHYGSYATYAIGLWVEIGFNVSIPLWFLRNPPLTETRMKSQSRFHTTMVLTQQGDLRGRSIRPQVSIPLWFLRNAEYARLMDLAHQFPYHYGSYAT